MNSEPLHPFIKGLVAVLLLLIPTLGSLILQSDPVISSSASAPDAQSIETVQTFAKFIETKPELAQPIDSPAPVNSTQTAGTPRSLEPVTDAQREVIAHAIENWQKPDVPHQDEWRREIEKLFYIAEATGSLDALDLLNAQVTLARKDADDINRSKADEWLQRYLTLETRENKRKQIVDYFREAVLEGVKDQP